MSIHHLSTKQKHFHGLSGWYSRPVELAELHETELDIAGLVFQERLANGGDALGDDLERGELQVGKLDTHIEYKMDDNTENSTRPGEWVVSRRAGRKL